MEKGELNIPESKLLNGSNTPIPYFLVGDAAFSINRYLMTPYSGTDLEHDKFLHNKELSRARMNIENSFGVLSARWRIFHTDITAEPETVDNIIRATVYLHNFLCSEGSTYLNKAYVDHERNGIVVDGIWRREIPITGTVFRAIPQLNMVNLFS